MSHSWLSTNCSFVGFACDTLTHGRHPRLLSLAPEGSFRAAVNHAPGSRCGRHLRMNSTAWSVGPHRSLKVVIRSCRHSITHPGSRITYLYPASAQHQPERVHLGILATSERRKQSDLRSVRRPQPIDPQRFLLQSSFLTLRGLLNHYRRAA